VRTQAISVLSCASHVRFAASWVLSREWTALLGLTRFPLPFLRLKLALSQDIGRGQSPRQSHCDVEDEQIIQLPYHWNE
jgi:hypothetical protein